MKSPKKIVIIFWDLGIGGIQTRFVDLINHLLGKSDLKIFLLLKRRLDGEIKIPQSDRLNVRYYSAQTRKHGEYESEPVGFGLWLLWQLVKIRPNYLLTFLCRYSLIGNIYKLLSFILFKPVTHTINEGILTSKYLLQHEAWYWRYIVRFSYPLADQLIVPTQAIKNDLANNFKVPEDNIFVIPSWVKERKLKKTNKKYAGIFVGRLAPEKGLKTLIELFKKCKKEQPQFKFAMIGDGEKKQWLVNKLKKYKLDNVNYLGYQSKEYTLKYLQQSRLLLLPSENEGLPMVVLEAASVGVPSLVSDLPGMREIIVDGENGFLCSTKNFQQYFYQIMAKNLWVSAGVKVLKRVRKKNGIKNLIKFSQLVTQNEHAKYV